MLILTMGTFLLAGCASVPTREQIAGANYGTYPKNYQASITNYMFGLLSDPYSAVYRFGTPYKGYAYVNGNSEPPVFGYLVDVGINARNRTGSYVGEEMFIFFLRDDELWLLSFFISRGPVYDQTTETPPADTSKYQQK